MLSVSQFVEELAGFTRLWNFGRSRLKVLEFRKFSGTFKHWNLKFEIIRIYLCGPSKGVVCNMRLKY